MSCSNNSLFVKVSLIQMGITRVQQIIALYLAIIFEWTSYSPVFCSHAEAGVLQGEGMVFYLFYFIDAR